MKFGDVAAELAGVAALLLGWHPNEFWDATPEELESALGAGRKVPGEIDRATLCKLQSLFPDEREK